MAETPAEEEKAPEPTKKRVVPEKPQQELPVTTSEILPDREPKASDDIAKKWAEKSEKTK